jgi:hypothetical protein
VKILLKKSSVLKKMTKTWIFRTNKLAYCKTITKNNPPQRKFTVRFSSQGNSPQICLPKGNLPEKNARVEQCTAGNRLAANNSPPKTSSETTQKKLDISPEYWIEV